MLTNNDYSTDYRHELSGIYNFSSSRANQKRYPINILNNSIINQLRPSKHEKESTTSGRQDTK